MDRFVERSYARVAAAATHTAGEPTADAGKMAATRTQAELLSAPDQTQPQLQPLTAPMPPAAIDPASPAGIAQAVVALLGPTLTATVDAAVHRGLEQLHIEVQAQAQRLTHAEDRISSLEDDSSAASAMLARIDVAHRDIWRKLDDLENRSRRNNLHIIGLPESVSATQLTNICAKIIPEQLGLRIPCTIERAHRIGQYSESHVKPRHVIVKYLNYADKAAIMQKFRRTRTLSVDGARLLLFAVYSVEVMKQRKAFSAICTTLHNAQIRFSLAYPALLRVQTQDGEQVTFATPDEAESYVNTLGTDMDLANSAENSSSPQAPSSSTLPKQSSLTKPPYKRIRVTQKEDRSGGR